MRVGPAERDSERLVKLLQRLIVGHCDRADYPRPAQEFGAKRDCVGRGHGPSLADRWIPKPAGTATGGSYITLRD